MTPTLQERLEKILPWLDYFIFRAEQKPGGHAEDLKAHRATIVASLEYLETHP